MTKRARNPDTDPLGGRSPVLHNRNHLRRHVIITTISLGMAIIGGIYSPLWLVAASLSVAAGALLNIAGSLRSVPHTYRHLRTKMAKAQEAAEQHPILLQYYRDGVARTAHELESVISGRFSFQIWQVPELSVHAMNLVDKRCTLMFPLTNSEALLTPDTGNAADYYRAMVATSKRMRDHGLDGVVRVFILPRSADITPRLLSFMGKNVEDNIDVRIVFEDELPPVPLAVDELDFGYYGMQDGHAWIMLLRSVEGTGDVPVTDYVVETDNKRVHQHRRFSDDVLTTARSFHDFMTLLAKPINGDLWPAYFAERGYEMLPPHGLSDADADYIVDSAIKGLRERDKAAVLVLGFTPKLLRRLRALSLKSVESLDQFPSKPQEFSEGVTFHTGNWLNSQLETYDAIVFDEALNNLSRLQLNLFFPQIASLLKPGGRIIGRVMGRFDEEVSERYLERTAWHAVENLRELGGTAHEDVSPLIICLLHSRHLAFSPELSSVDCGAWNRSLQELRNANRITDAEYRIWRLQFTFKLLSPDLDSLVSEAQQSGFSPAEVRAVQGDYVGKWNDTAEFYRIVNFELTRKAEPSKEPRSFIEDQQPEEVPWGFRP